MDDPIAKLFFGIAAGILITWLFGMLPALVARYVVIRRPLARAASNWIAGLSCASMAFVGAAMNSAAGIRGLVNLLPLILIFFVARWIMSRDPVGRLAKRNELIEKLRTMSRDPDTSSEKRAWAIDRLEKMGRSP